MSGAETTARARGKGAIFLLAMSLWAAACNNEAPSDGGTTGGGMSPTDLPPCEAKGAPTSLGPSFVDVTGVMDSMVVIPPQHGLSPEPTWGAFTDLDGDGEREIITVPFGLFRHEARAGISAVDIDWIPGGSFVAAVDVDGDGRDDLVRAGGEWPGYGVSYFDAATTQPAGDQEGPSGVLAFEDLDGDGWLDIVGSSSICCAICRDFRPMFRVGKRAFAERNDLVKGGVQVSTFAMLVSRPGPGEILVTTLGNSCPGDPQAQGFYRVESVDDEGYPHFVSFDPMPATPHYLYDQQMPKPGKLPITISSPMGGTTGDIDGDGIQDLVLDLFGHNFYRGGGSWPLEDMSTRAGLAVQYAGRELEVTPWGVLLVDVDQDGRPDVIVAHGNDFAAWSDPEHHDHLQSSTLHWNGGDFCFADMSDLSNLGRAGQWQAITMDDIDGDGDADLILGGQGEVPRVFRNDVTTGNHGLSLRLKGTTSNHLAIGAKVDVLTQGVPDQHFVVAGSGSPSFASVSPLFAGLGPNTAADLVRVTWPSGVVQDLPGLAAGQLHAVVEPPLFTIEPAERHVPADGASVAALHITPRNADGTVRLGAKIEVVVAHGKSVAIGPPAMDGDASVVQVTAPAAAGSTVLEVRIDGVASGVRPRIWWTK